MFISQLQLNEEKLIDGIYSNIISLNYKYILIILHLNFDYKQINLSSLTIISLSLKFSLKKKENDNSLNFNILSRKLSSRWKISRREIDDSWRRRVANNGLLRWFASEQSNLAAGGGRRRPFNAHCAPSKSEFDGCTYSPVQNLETLGSTRLFATRQGFLLLLLLLLLAERR